MRDNVYCYSMKIVNEKLPSVLYILIFHLYTNHSLATPWYDLALGQSRTDLADLADLLSVLISGVRQLGPNPNFPRTVKVMSMSYHRLVL